MATDLQSKPTFSPGRKWGTGLHLCVLLAVVFSVVVMTNYLGRQYYLRLHVSGHNRLALSPVTLKFLRAMTNQVNVTLYYNKNDPFFSTVADLLNEYQAASRNLKVQTVDYLRDPGAAFALREKYKFLASRAAKDLIIFDCAGNVTPVDGKALTQSVLEPVRDEEGVKFRRKPVAFAGERACTAALLAVTNPKPLKAYFLEDDGEHSIESDDDTGFSKFAAVLEKQLRVKTERLSLLGTNSVPGDCNLLVIAGPATPLAEPVLDKVDRYLNEGGRLLVLFSFSSIRKETGLEPILAKWGVDVGNQIIRDESHSLTESRSDIIVEHFGKHQVVNPLLDSKLHLILPRAISRLGSRTAQPDAPQVEEIAFTSPEAVAAGAAGRAPATFPLMAVVEKGAIKDVVTERGNTRMLIAGDSIFLANHQIDSAANRDFAQYAAAWLLDRTQLLAEVGIKPVEEYRFVLTRAQMQGARWLLLGGLPGCALVLGSLVWLRRSR
jgi:hypothetical protein